MASRALKRSPRWPAGRTAFFGLLLLILCVARARVSAPAHADTIFPGNYVVTTEETWSVGGSPYVVHGSLSVASTGHLHLEPGVEVQIGSGEVFDVQNGGTLTALGTAADPITITSISANFIGLRLWSGSHASLAYCDLSLAGHSAWPPLDIQSSDVTVDHCTIRDSGVGSGYAVGLAGTGLSPSLTNTIVENNTGYAIYQSTIDMTPSYANLTLTGNGTDAVVWTSGTLNRAVSLEGPQLNGRPFIALDDITLSSSGRLTLTAGTELLMSASRGLWVEAGGTLAAEGTEGAPVTVAPRDVGSPFLAITFLPGSAGALTYCDIHHAGASAYATLDIQSSDVALDHCTVHDNGVASGHAIRLTGAGLSPSFKDTAIQNNTGYAIYQSTIDMTPEYQNLTISGNGTDAVAWDTGYLNRSLVLDDQQIDGRPFISLQTINVNNGGHLTLNPGTELQMEGGRGLWVQSGGILTAAGTVSNPAVLTARDTAAPFVKLDFLPGSTGSLTHFHLSYAGASSSPALHIESSDVDLDNCLIHDNVAGSGAAVFLQGAGLSPTLANTTIRDNSGRAVQQTHIDMTPVYTNVTFSGNGTDAVVIDNGGLYRAVTLDGTRLKGSPFIALNQINVWDGAHLTLAPGTELRMSAGKAIYVESGGALTAEGTPPQPVVLTSVEPGTLWLKVHFLPGSTSSLAHCDVSRAGTSGYDALAIYTPDVALSHCIVHDNAASGVRLFDGAGSPVLDNMVLVDNGVDGLRVESGNAPTMRHATIARNGDGVHIVDGGAAVFTNTIVAGNGVGVRVVGGGSVTMAHTLWDANGQDVVGVVAETNRVEGSAGFDADGYHLTSGSAALERGGVTGVLDDIDGEARPQPPGTSPDLGADECTSSLQAWDKWIDGQPWELGFTDTVEISTTVETVDVIRAEADAPFTLIDTWTAEQLSLTDVSVEPSDTGVVTQGRGSLTWSVALGHPGTMTLTKRLNVDPGPWTEIVLEETLDGLDVSDPSRSVTLQRLARHDVAVVGASPGGELPVGQAASVTAELLNAGTETESAVPVQCIIEDAGATRVYSETRASGEIAPAVWSLVGFPAWTPLAPGAYTLTCRSILPNDADPANDVHTEAITASLDGGPDVWMKDNAEDDGDVPSGHPWWVSPDIWVRHEPDGGLVHQNPIALQENTVYVRLRNRGQKAASGEVGVFWSRSRMGWPCKVGSNNVGTITFQDLATGEVRVVSVSWTPQEAGRHGLHTVIEADGDPADGNAPCSPHRPRWDNNVSWRNTVAHFRLPGGGSQALAVEQAEVDLVNVHNWP
ncbi:MAG: right-handed parallel beta-helix repeat-containing protein, partial [Anaerolineae bacterium]